MDDAGGKMIGLIIPVLSNFKGLAELMHSVDVSIMPIIIDNWNENRGVSGGWNEGIDKAISLGLEQVIISNDDITFEAGTMEKITDALDSFDLVTATNSRDHKPEPGFDLGPDFSCFAINPKRFIDSFGYFDENFKPAYFEDNDMHYRISLAGGTAARIKDAMMNHIGSVTQNKGGNGTTDERVVSHEMFRSNRIYYWRKWGGVPGRETFSHPFNNKEHSIKDWKC